MLRKNPIFYSALLLTAVNLLLKLSGTVFGVYLSGQIGAAGVGLLQLVLSVGSLSLTLGAAGIRTATMYLCAEELGKGRPQNIGWVLGSCIRYSLCVSLPAGIALFCFAPWISRFWIGDAGTLTALRILAVFLPVSCLCGVVTGYYTAARRIGSLAAVEVLEQVLSMGITMVLLHLGAKNTSASACTAVVLGSCGSSTVALLLLFFMARPAPRQQPIPVRKRLLSIAVPLALADDLKTGLSTTENLMVPKRLALYPGLADPLAAFGAVCGMVFPVMMFPAAILYALAELLIPELARCNAAGSRRRIRYLTGRSLKVALLYGCFFGGLLFLVATPLCQALYRDAAPGQYLRLYALLIPMLYCDAVTDAINKGLGQQHICVRYNIFTAAMDLCGLFFLLPRLGMTGYFISFLVSHGVNFYLSMGLMCRITHRSWKLKIPATAVLCTGICVCFTLGLSQTWPRVLAYLALWGSLLTLTGLFSAEDRKWLAALAKGRQA